MMEKAQAEIEENIVKMQIDSQVQYSSTSSHLSRSSIIDPPSLWVTVRHVTGNDKDYLRKIPRVVW